jgi:acyl-CoA thioesterase
MTDPGEVVEAMHGRDPSAEAFGIRLVEVGAGRATLEMTVAAWMCNGLGTCHGGVVFTLADSAMAYASNSHGEVAFAVAATVDLLAPASNGDVLRAVATEQWLGGRTAMYDATVELADGTTVAMFRGRVRRMGTAVLDGRMP